MQSAIDIVSNNLSTLSGTVTNINNKIPAVTTKTLAANGTSVEFDVPTTGNNNIEFYISDGVNYSAINTNTSGKVTLTYEASAVARTVSCSITKAD